MGGAEYQASILVDNLIKRNKYTIYCLSRQVNVNFRPSKYKIVKIGTDKGISRYGYYFDTIKVLSVLNLIDPDIIYQKVGCAYTGIAAYYSQYKPAKMIWQIESDIDVTPFESGIRRNIVFTYIEKKMLEYGIKRADSIVALTNNQNEMLENHYNRTATAVIPIFHPPPREKSNKCGPVRIIWVANIKPLKRPELFVMLARELQGLESAEFIMIGQPSSDRKFMHNLSEQMSDLRNFKYLGGCTQKQVNEIMSKSHIFVNTSIYEGFPNTFIQAWMRRLPVVSINANPDNTLHKHSLGFHSGSYEQMVKDVKSLIMDPTMRNDIGARAESYALANHSEKNLEQLIRLLELN